MIEEVLKRHINLLNSVKKTGCFEIEIKLIFPTASFQIVKIDRDAAVFKFKCGATAFNTLQKFNIYDVQLNKNDVCIRYKSLTKDIASLRLATLSSYIKESFSNEVRRVNSGFSLLKKKKESLSDEERHEINMFQKKMVKANDEFSKALKAFEKLAK